MAALDNIASKLMEAKETLRKAKEWAPPLKIGTPMAPSVHPSYANAAYSAVKDAARKALSSPQTEKEAKDIASGINWRLQQQKSVK
ncbi:MAG TPA: hypothetical protein VFA52_03945 [Candidatus Paceibacterota bacterium]|jgi:uracil-DNA glycosylase|nr:hypothetical protein [Candidatus Paceibacterota bacterium]